MEQPGYKPRTHEFLLKECRRLQNLLQLRDWHIDLLTGDTMPENEDYDNPAQVVYYLAVLRAVIRIDQTKCKEQDLDPLHALYHEFAHILLAYCTYEERMCNILADIMYQNRRK